MESVDLVINKFLKNTNLSSKNQSEPTMTIPTSTSCCDGSGYHIEVINGYTFVKECSCMEIKRMNEMLEKSGISDEFRKISFRNYFPYDEKTEESKSKAMGYVKDFESIRNERNNSIAFLGQVGAGKTHLCMAVANNLMKKKIPVLFMPYREVVTDLKQNMLDEEYYQKSINKYKNAQVLYIDDLFKGKINESDINIIFEIVNYRYLKYSPIIVSSEFDVEKLLNFDEAIGSRILEMSKNHLIQFNDKKNNYRLRGLIK